MIEIIVHRAALTYHGIAGYIGRRRCAMKELDVTTIAPRDRHPLIFKMFDELAQGDAMVLTNDHDPKPLYYSFLHERQEQFEWEYHEQGPERWKVRIAKK
jgi:uncharacterized protein (DUF2249 family)